MSKAAENKATPNGPMPEAPDCEIDAKEVFGVDIDMKVPAFSERNEYVPDFDADYLFDKQTTLALLAGLPIIAASWCKAITARVNRPILNKSPHA